MNFLRDGHYYYYYYCRYQYLYLDKTFWIFISKILSFFKQERPVCISSKLSQNSGSFYSLKRSDSEKNIFSK